jgi:Uma2 family endonuclease
LPAVVAAIPALSFDEDQRVVLGAMAWQDFEAMLAIRGERSGVRMYYLDGAIEIMSPTKIHEGRKKALARLLEMWTAEKGLILSGYGAWTLKHERRDAGAEPDECYILGDVDKDIPDLVIEVEWSRVTGLSKPEIYRRLGVRELWTLKSDGALVIRVLENGDWIESTASLLFPDLDLPWLLSLLEVTPPGKAVLMLRDAMRAMPRRG